MSTPRSAPATGLQAVASSVSKKPPWPRFPGAARAATTFCLGLRTLGFERRVTIAFSVLKTQVEIVTIAYAGRNFEDDLQG